MHDKVQAEAPGGRKGTFSRMNWKTMLKNPNNPWREVTNDGKAPKPTGTQAAANEAKTEADYRQIFEQAKGFAKDGKKAEALERYKAAAVLKPSPYLKGVINKLSAELEAENSPAAKEDARLELIVNAEDAALQGDYETALEFYGEAQKLNETEEVAQAIKATEAKQKDALVE